VSTLHLYIQFGVNGCLIYHFRFTAIRFLVVPFLPLPFLPVAFFTRCPFYRCPPFYQLPKLPFPFYRGRFYRGCLLVFTISVFTVNHSINLKPPTIKANTFSNSNPNPNRYRRPVLSLMLGHRKFIRVHETPQLTYIEYIF